MTAADLGENYVSDLNIIIDFNKTPSNKINS